MRSISSSRMSYQRIQVSHLSSTLGVYSTQYDESKQTLFLMPSFSMSYQVFESQYKDAQLLEKMNLICVEPLGQGSSKAGTEHFTYWDTALCALEVLSQLKIPQIFALGMSQGGWIVSRMALLKPEAIKGLIILGSSMAHESQESVDRGCWKIHESFNPMIQHLSQKDENFQPPPPFLEAIFQSGLGSAATPEFKDFWTPKLVDIYKGEEGRKRLRMISINLRDRDTLYGRLADIEQPVLWLQGTEDKVYSVAQAENDFKLFSSSKGSEMRVVQGGQHFLAASNASEVDQETIKFVEKWS